MTTNKKIWIFGVVVLVSLIMIIVISQPKKEPSEPMVKIGYSSQTPWGLFFFVAQEKGFFKKYGLNVQLKEMEIAALIPAILAKDIDYFSFTSTAVRASLQGAPIKTIMGLTEHSFFALSAQPGLKLNDIKSIGIANWLSPTHYLALKTIEEHNLSAKIIASGSIPGQPALLVSGQTDTIIPTILTALQLQKEGYPVLKTFDDDKLPQGLTTSDDKIENHPEEVEKIVKAIQSSIVFVQNNPKEAKELFCRYLGWEKDESTQPAIEELYSILIRGIVKDGIPKEEGINMLIKLGKTAEFKTLKDIEKQEVTEGDIAKAFDFRFIK